MKKIITQYDNNVGIFKMMFLIFIECIVAPLQSSYIVVAKDKSCIVLRCKSEDVTITDKEDGTFILETEEKK